MTEGVARVELSIEARAIESLIDAGQKDAAATRLRAASAYFGRRPEYRYLACFYDTRFRIRPDADLLREVTELASDQPELVEATALLAELHARAGDEARAGFFARMALESTNPSTRARAMGVLSSHAPPGQSADESGERLPPWSSAQPRSTPPDTRVLNTWFERARRELVHHRSPSYGVRTLESVGETLLDWGRTVAQGQSFLSTTPLPLTRESLTLVDDAVLALRRQVGRRGASQSDTSRNMAIAGFFLAVVLHELEASVLEISPADGGCKVILPSGAGARPLLVATSYIEGTGPSLVQTFDRLASARELATAPPSSHSLQRVSSGRMPASTRTVSSKPTLAAVPPRDELAVSRSEVEAAPVREVERPTGQADAPPFDMPQVAASLARSPVGQEIASRSGAFLAPTPASIEALESYLSATRGEAGARRNQPGWQPSDPDEELILAFGALLGETLISAYGGVWETDANAPSDPRLFRVVCQERLVIWPITQVYLRLAEGSRHSLIDFLAEIGTRLG